MKSTEICLFGSDEMEPQRTRQELWIQGMMLETSAARLEETLKGLDGVEDVNVSFRNASVRFAYDPAKISLKRILKTIRELGFIPSDRPPEPARRSRAPERRPAAPVKNPAPEGHADSLIRRVLKIDGMTCPNCEMRIENRVRKTPGVREVRVSYARGTARVGYDPRVISIGAIIEVIEKLDYRVADHPKGRAAGGARTKDGDKLPINQLLGIGIILLAGYLIIRNTIGFNFIPAISQNMGYGILFVVGLVTSLHCVAMCGGINLSQAVRQFPAGQKRASKLGPSLMYNAGRVISYTALGGIVGALGSVVSFSGTAKGIVSILAGVFMVLMGLNMLNIFPGLRRFMPHMPKVFGRKIHAGSGKRGPLYVGLLNGLMPCGPLQAMQIYALGTGSPAKGALSMLVFSLGTVPLMFGFGAVSSLLSSRFTRQMMKVSAALVMILGIVMLNRGFSLSGFNLVAALAPKAAGSGAVATLQDGEQLVTTRLEANRYAPITVQKDVPVKWTIKADVGALNGCNGTVTIPQYHVSKTLQPGDNEIDFTPRQTGSITYTCSMGMISSTISVVPDLTKATVARSDPQPAASGLSSGVGVAQISGNQQSVTVSVAAGGYTPAILVLQKGVPAVIRFDVRQLNSCDGTVVFPELGGELNLSSQKSTPVFTPQSDFSFECGMGMLSGYVKVVDDISRIDLNAIQKEAKSHVSTGGMPCCQ